MYFARLSAKARKKQKFFLSPMQKRATNKNFFVPPTQKWPANKNFLLALARKRATNKNFFVPQRESEQQTEICCSPRCISPNGSASFSLARFPAASVRQTAATATFVRISACYRRRNYYSLLRRYRFSMSCVRALIRSLTLRIRGGMADGGRVSWIFVVPVSCAVSYSQHL